jgi:heme/copper-type cytochrome/quinol oxidase subunit 2
VVTYEQSAVVMALLICVGWLFIKTTNDDKSSLNSRILRWTGYGLIVMTIFLIVYGVLHYFAAESHRHGH